MANDKEVLGTLRENLEGLYEELWAIKESLTKDHEQEVICAGYSDYQKENPGVTLKRGKNRIRKTGYNVCLAGGFSGGKSTLINALLEEPGMLAAEAGECTMSITSITAPASGEEERISVHYFTKEDALNNLIQNTRYYSAFEGKVDELLAEPDEGKVVAFVKEAAEKLLKDPDGEEKKKGRDLKEFYECMEKFADRLGTEYVDRIENSKVYLTTDKDDKGLGHLLLIEQVFIYRHNRLFVENGINIVDLPGTDSPNERQKELTHQAMAEADVVLLTLEPKGFKMADVLIGKELGKHYGTIRNKVFIIVNKFDTLDSTDIAKDQIEKLYKGQMMEQIIKAGFNPERVYFTSSKYSLLRTMKESGSITDAGKKELESMKTSIEGKLSSLDRTIIPEIIEKMEKCYKDGGVSAVRNDLIGYLEYDVQLERLRDIHSDLKSVYDITRELLDPERGKIEDLVEKQKNMSSRILEFIDEIKNVFEDSTRKFEVNMEGALKKLLQPVHIRIDKFSALIAKLNFERIESTISLPNTHKIKIAIIDMCKEKLGEAFLDGVIENSVYPLLSKIKDELEKTNIEKICKHFSSDSMNFSKEYADLNASFEERLKFVAGLRVSEEVWRIATLEISPSGSPAGAWGDAEKKAFREDIKKLFADKYSGALKTLEVVLPRYFREVLKFMREGFNEMMTEMTKIIRMADNVDLPLDLLYQDEGDDMQAKKKILNYIMHFNKAQENVDAITELNVLE